jgi:hypothetical protein
MDADTRDDGSPLVVRLSKRLLLVFPGPGPHRYYIFNREFEHMTMKECDEYISQRGEASG